MGNVPTKPQTAQESSTEAIYEILNKAIKEPKLFTNDTEFKTALKSQGGIAKLQGEWKSETCSISKKKMTLNTLKKHAKKLFSDRFDDGWDVINGLRVDAKDAIESELNSVNKPTKRTKIGLQKIVKEREDTLEKQKEVNFILLQALSSAMQTIKTVSETAKQELREERALRGIEKLRAIVSLNQPPYNKLKDKGNVVSIAGSETGE